MSLSLDRLDLYARLAQNGVRVPSFRLLAPFPREYPEWPSVTILRPAGGLGGARGVVRLLPRVSRDWAASVVREASGGGRIMAERWLDGEQFILEARIRNKRAELLRLANRCLDRLEDVRPFCVDDGYSGPVALYDQDHSDDLAELETLAERVAATLLVRAGLLKIELVRHRQDSWYVIGARHVEAPVFPEKPGSAYYYFCQRWIFPGPDDAGKRIMAVPKPRPGVHWQACMTDERVHAVTHNALRWGSVTTHSDSMADAIERAERLAAEMYSEVRLKKVDDEL